MYDNINLYLNDNSTQIRQSIVFKLSDHKAYICFYPLIAKIVELLNILYFQYFFENQAFLNTNHFDTTCRVENSIEYDFKPVINI